MRKEYEHQCRNEVVIKEWNCALGMLFNLLLGLFSRLFSRVQKFMHALVVVVLLVVDFLEGFSIPISEFNDWWDSCQGDKKVNKHYKPHYGVLVYPVNCPVS